MAICRFIAIVNFQILSKVLIPTTTFCLINCINEQDMRPATSAYIPQRHISNSRTRPNVLISRLIYQMKTQFEGNDREGYSYWDIYFRFFAKNIDHSICLLVYIDYVIAIYEKVHKHNEPNMRIPFGNC